MKLQAMVACRCVFSLDSPEQLLPLWANIILVEDHTRSMKLHKRLEVRNKGVIPVHGCRQVAIDDNKIGGTRVRDPSSYHTLLPVKLSLFSKQECTLFHMASLK